MTNKMGYNHLKWLQNIAGDGSTEMTNDEITRLHNETFDVAKAAFNEVLSAEIKCAEAMNTPWATRGADFDAFLAIHRANAEAAHAAYKAACYEVMSVHQLSTEEVQTAVRVINETKNL